LETLELFELHGDVEAIIDVDVGALRSSATPLFSSISFSLLFFLICRITSA
jgi:hypothetical protein